AVAHAGEEGPPHYIWRALDDLGVERVDHGVRCLEDPQLVERLRRERIPLTVCPLSNVALKVVDRLEDHPLPKMVDAGLFVTINSDDPAYFGGYVGDNYAAVAKTFGWDLTRMAELAANSLEASFQARPGAGTPRSRLRPRLLHPPSGPHAPSGSPPARSAWATRWLRRPAARPDWRGTSWRI